MMAKTPVNRINNLKFRLFYIALTWLPVSAFAQLTEQPLEKKITPRKTSSAKIQTAIPLVLPFWDDFSYTTEDHALDSLWINNSTVLVGSGQGVNPPTINVATFDGLKENGTPYSTSPTDEFDFGYRDTLESQPIKMTDVAVFLRNSVFLSFYYQGGGNGEPPDPKDFLQLDFKTNTGPNTWETVAKFVVDNDFDPDIFYDTLIRINLDKFYHDDFRFRFISFGRKSGRYDAWHIDYVYLNKGRDENDKSRPDRAITSKLTSLFDGYYAIPKNHLDSSRTISAPQFEAYNLRAGDSTTTTYQIMGTFTNYNNGVSTMYSTQIGPALPGINGGNAIFEALSRKLVTLPYLPDPNNNTQFDYTADSIKVKLSVKLFADDVYDVDTGMYSEDYDSASHYPIDFRANDTTSQSYSIKDFYAYDDGAAEYAVELTSAGNQVAYLFKMKTDTQDTINGLFINFPIFSGASADNVDIFISKSKNGSPGPVIYDQNISITHSGNNALAFVPLLEGVIVNDTFFIGYREPSQGHVRVGLDKSNDTGNRLYYKINETSSWQINDRISGSLLIRPRFGNGPIVSGVPEEQQLGSIYPNPSSGEFYLKGSVNHIQVINLAGQSINFTVEDFIDGKRISMMGAPSGIYVIRYRVGAKLFTEKIIIRK